MFIQLIDQLENEQLTSAPLLLYSNIVVAFVLPYVSIIFSLNVKYSNLHKILRTSWLTWLFCIQY